MNTLTLACRSGPVTVPIVAQSAGLALHRASSADAYLKDWPWAISHEASGKIVLRVRTQLAGRRILRALARLDWTLPEEQIRGEHKQLRDELLAGTMDAVASEHLGHPL